MPARSRNDPNYHVGHLFIDCMRQKRGGICQIDAATGEEETYESVISRFIRLAKCLRKLGFQPGDVLALSGKNHIDLHIPYYAALVNGYPICGVDPQFKYDEVKAMFKILQPKLAFCDDDQYDIYVKAVEDLSLNTSVYRFTGENSMAELIISYKDNEPLDDFEVAEFDLDKVYVWLASTGGTTGVIKAAAIKHKICMEKVLSSLQDVLRNEPIDVQKVGLNLSSVQWGSAFANAVLMPMANLIKVQTSAPPTVEHVIDIINKYKPSTLMSGPPLVAAIVKHEKKCDLTCFSTIVLGGSKAHREVLIELNKRKRPDAIVMEMYGQTENMGDVFKGNPRGPLGNCGLFTDFEKFKFVDPDTEKEITEPNIPGELWSKGATFSGYYNDPEETANAFTKDGWFKSGDILYRDENNNIFYVDRIKMLIKCKRRHVSPLEIEDLIHTIPGVLDVAVTAIPDPEDGQHPAACVVKEKGSSVTAQEIKELVANKLSDSKQLRGGVVFVDEIPMTSAGKVARSKLKNVVLNGVRE